MLGTAKGSRVILFFLAAAAWFIGWVWFARHYYLDDALIHARYAELLWRYGFLTFDGVHKTFGSSSLLYVSIISVFRNFADPAITVKFLSTGFYSVLLVMLGAMAVKSGNFSRKLWMALFVTVLSPMAMRWFNDGMETSFVVFVSAVFALICSDLMVNTARSRLKYACLALFSGLTVLLRIELLILVWLASIGIWVYLKQSGSKDPLSRIIIRNSYFIFGSSLAALIIYSIFGQLLPDTAVAKSGFFNMFAAANILLAIASSLSLGLGLILIWFLSMARLFMARAYKEGAEGLITTAVINSAPFILAFLIIIRGQCLQGVRYFLGCFIFAAVWNIRMISMKSAEQVKDRCRCLDNLPVAILLVVLSIWPYESFIAGRIINDRSKVFVEMRSQKLNAILDGKCGIAFDIGFISYFTKGRIFDMSGLVNGREFASKKHKERAKYYSRQDIAFAFLTKSQAWFVNRWIDMDGWVVCYKYECSNIRKTRPYYLIVKPELAEKLSKHPLGIYGDMKL